MIKKRRMLLILLVLLSLMISLGVGWYYHHYYTGPRSGVVVDAVTGKPIAGAVVCMQWNTSGFFTVTGGVLAAAYETKTDEQGRYFIPSQKLEYSFRDGDVHPEDVMIYKDGYCGYKVTSNFRGVGRSYSHKDEVDPYHRRKNKVQLFPFCETESHYRHLDWIEIYGINGWPEDLLKTELLNEMRRADQDGYTPPHEVSR